MILLRSSLHRVSFIIICLFLALNAPSAFAQAPAEAIVYFIPEETRLQVGELVEMVIEVAEVQGLYGFDLQLTFDPQILEVVDADPARDGVQVQQGDFLDIGFIARNETDNQNGRVWFVMTQLNPSEAKSGAGALIVVQFRSRQSPGETLVEIAHIQLANRDGVEIPAKVQPVRVEVTAAPENYPTQPAPSLPATDTPLPVAPTVTSTSLPPSTPTLVAPAPTATIQPAAEGLGKAEITTSTGEASAGLHAESDESDVGSEAGAHLQAQTPTVSSSQTGEEGGSHVNRFPWLTVVISAGLGIGLIVLIFMVVAKRKAG